MFNKSHPRVRYTYAVTTGVFVGEILVYIENSNDHYHFLSIPKMENRSIPHNKFKEGLEVHIVDIVEKIPKSIYKVCEAQYKKNANTTK